MYKITIEYDNGIEIKSIRKGINDIDCQEAGTENALNFMFSKMLYMLLNEKEEI